jgi:hypothetical protein
MDPPDFLINAPLWDRTKNPLAISGSGSSLDNKVNFDNVYMGGPPLPNEEHMQMPHIIIGISNLISISLTLTNCFIKLTRSTLQKG